MFSNQFINYFFKRISFVCYQTRGFKIHSGLFHNYPTETKSFRKEQQMKTENGLKFYPKNVFKCLLLEDFRNFRSARSFN